MTSPLHRVPCEIQDVIVKEVLYRDRLSFLLVYRHFSRICYYRIKKLQSINIAPWAGERLPSTGDCFQTQDIATVFLSVESERNVVLADGESSFCKIAGKTYVLPRICQLPFRISNGSGFTLKSNPEIYQRSSSLLSLRS